MTTSPALQRINPALIHLRHRVKGTLLTPHDDGYDQARKAWNLEVDQRPAAVVVAENAAEIQRAVKAAAVMGLGSRSPSHRPRSQPPCDGGLLIVTAQMNDVAVDPETRTARVGAGAVWRDVIEAAAEHGLVGLSGSSPGVGVVGYTLGGGFGWLGRRYGLASHSVTRAEVVIATGELLVASEDKNPDLLWGLRGGTGNFGIVTALEFRLHPLTQVYAGNLYYPLDRARDVLAVFADWTRRAPDDLTGAATFRRFPPLPSISEQLRGQSLVALRGCWSGDLAQGAAFIDHAAKPWTAQARHLRADAGGRHGVDQHGPGRPARRHPAHRDPPRCHTGTHRRPDDNGWPRGSLAIGDAGAPHAGRQTSGPPGR